MKIFFALPEKSITKKIFLLENIESLKPSRPNLLFSPRSDFKYLLQRTDKVEVADAIVVAVPIHPNDKDLVRYVRGLIKAHNKLKTFFFVGGDLSHAFCIKGALALKGTQYRRFLDLKNEIIIPPICDDLGEGEGVELREKRTKPTVSFCGWAGFQSKTHYFKYLAKLALVDLKKVVLFDSSLEVFKQGLYFRRKALKSFKNQSLVDTSFIVRKSFSGNAKTIALDPNIARREYIENMKNSDFVLAPKGDANYSVRFFEALSLGRIPILIDTEVCLPMENEIDYSKCVLRVSYKDIKRLPQIVAAFYEKLSPEEWLAMQEEARRVFKEYLRYDSFFNRVFSRYSNDSAKYLTKIS